MLNTAPLGKRDQIWRTNVMGKEPKTISAEGLSTLLHTIILSPQNMVYNDINYDIFLKLAIIRMLRRSMRQA